MLLSVSAIPYAMDNPKKREVKQIQRFLKDYNTLSVKPRTMDLNTSPSAGAAEVAFKVLNGTSVILTAEEDTYGNASVGAGFSIHTSTLKKLPGKIIGSAKNTGKKGLAILKKCGKKVVKRLFWWW